VRARDLFRAIDEYSVWKFKVPEEILCEIPDEQFRVAVQAAAMLLKTLKAEAVRRGIWEELKGMKVQESTKSLAKPP
jgi:hypothetical protein